MDKENTKEDASPLSTSTESETFDTWTLISSDRPTDLSSGETAFTPEKTDDDADTAHDVVRVEVVNVDAVVDAINADAVKEPEEPGDSRNTDVDDLSDGISIISESESVGRLSPHPELRKRLSELNMLFINAPESPALATAEGCCPALNYDACSERSSDTFHRVEPLLESTRRPRRSSHQVVGSTSKESTVAEVSTCFGLRGLFYIGALLAVIAFISKVKNDAWESVIGTETGLLTQKINELELNNNLMRAEIDILSKQVKYLTTLSENLKIVSTNKPKNSQPQQNTFKAWPGNGVKIEEVLITPEDLKKPFKCDGHNHVDVAGMCIDLTDSTDTIDKAEDFPMNIEELTEPLPTPPENPSPSPSRESPIDQQPRPDYTPHEHIPAEKFENKKYVKRDRKHSKNRSDENKENDRPRRDRSSEERDTSAERHKKSKDHKKNEKQGSAEYEKAKREADGYWHEKMMQHRENSRKQNDKHRQERNDKNWYIERGDSREQARHDHKHRGTGQR